MSFILPSLIEKTNKCLINVIVTQHHRRPSEQIPRKPVVLGYIVAGFGSFWLVLWVVLGGFGWFCWRFWVVSGFSNYRNPRALVTNSMTVIAILIDITFAN